MFDPVRPSRCAPRTLIVGSKVTQTIEIFRAGQHTAMSGEQIGFSESDLQASAGAYDPSLHEAPIVVGHPKHDAPAYGWVKGLSAEGGSLKAEAGQVEPSFAEAVREGRYKKVSASFYKPDSQSNPKPGVYYLRHVGFLGAQPPAVKGLSPIELAEAGEEAVTVEFGDVSGWKLGDLFRSMRNWLIDQFGTEAADSALPEHLVTGVQEEAVEEPPTQPQYAYSEPARPAPSQTAKGASVTTNPTQTQGDPDREAEIARREQEIQRREAEFAERERQQRRQEREAQLDALVQDGRPLPTDKGRLLAFMDAIDGQDAVQFAEGESQDPNKFLMDEVLGKLPKQVDYSERAPAGEEDVETGDATQLAREAVAYQEEQRQAGVEITTSQAVAEISKRKSKPGQGKETN